MERQNQLKERSKKFIEEFEMPITVFCKHVGFSTRSWYFWIKDQLSFASATLDKIDNYLSKYGF